MVISWREVFFPGSSSDCAAKLLLFFDMAMGCPGCRALLVRIACNQALGYLGYLGYPTCVYFMYLSSSGSNALKEALSPFLPLMMAL